MNSRLLTYSLKAASPQTKQKASNTILLCHKGNNYKVIDRLASQGNNVCVVEHQSSKIPTTISTAEHICLKYKRPCITVLPANIYDPKNIEFVFDQTTNIYGTIDGLVLYNDYKWESNAILNKYLDSIISNGNISVVDPHTI